MVPTPGRQALMHTTRALVPGKGWLWFGPLFLKVMITHLFLYSFVHSTLFQRGPLQALRWTLVEDATPHGLVLTELRQEAEADTPASLDHALLSPSSPE